LVSELAAVSADGAAGQVHADTSSKPPKVHLAAPPPAAQAPAASMEPTGRRAKGLVLFALLMMLVAYSVRPFALKPSNVGVVDASKILKHIRPADITKTPSMPLPAAAPQTGWGVFSPPPPQDPPPPTLLQRLIRRFERLMHRHR
jgi:hypothetical protein